MREKWARREDLYSRGGETMFSLIVWEFECFTVLGLTGNNVVSRLPTSRTKPVALPMDRRAHNGESAKDREGICKCSKSTLAAICLIRKGSNGFSSMMTFRALESVISSLGNKNEAK